MASRSTKRPSPPTDDQVECKPKSRWKLATAAVGGVCAGAARALTSWLLTRLTEDD